MNLIAEPYFFGSLACAAIIMAMAASVALILLRRSMKRKIDSLEDQLSAVSEPLRKLSEISTEMEQIRGRLAEVEQSRSPFGDWSGEPGSINLNRRGQVLRLHRRGESSSQIASALGLSQGEVTLIVKVHELTRLSSQAEISQERPLIPRRIFDTDTRTQK